jgi:hypothetical protein
VESLALPTSGILASRASASGSVRADVTIGTAGQVSKLGLDGGDAALRGEVGAALGISRFQARCAGRKVKLEFAFTLIDPPSDNIIPPAVRFVPPNRFELTFRRVKPTID